MRIGVTPGGNVISTEPLVSVKSTPESPGLIAEGGVAGDAPLILGLSMN